MEWSWRKGRGCEGNGGVWCERKVELEEGEGVGLEGAESEEGRSVQLRFNYR